MYCKNCGNAMDPQSMNCPKCGATTGTGMQYCATCGNPINPQAPTCPTCGTPTAPQTQQTNPQYGPQTELKSKMAAGLLGIFLGTFGVHNFYLGYTNKAIAQVLLGGLGILLSPFTCFVSLFATSAAGIWGLIEGIMILTGNINVDEQGRPLKD